MSGFQLPKLITDYLNQSWRKPPTNFINSSQFYAGLDPYFINYMTNVVRPCLTYSVGSSDLSVNSGIKMNIGYTIIKNAVGLITSGKIMYEGDNAGCHILSDHWQAAVGFPTVYHGLVHNLLSCGTTVLKLNIDANGRCFPSTIRADRYYATTDDNGDIVNIVFFNSFLSSEKYGQGVEASYWLVEERYWKKGKRFIRYKVQTKSGVAGHEVLPSIYDAGIPEKNLPDNVKDILKRRNIKVNKEIPLDFRDGLGCWLIRLTADNSCVPGLAMGDPLLYGVLDLLWATDVVFSGTLTDVLNGRGKILVPKKYLSTIRDFVTTQSRTATNVTEFSQRLIKMMEDSGDDDDGMVYVTTEHDKDFTPQSVQFTIRSQEYGGMLELYLRQIVSACGFAPTSIFPFLKDDSNKTATEVTADENLTRNTIMSIHHILETPLNRLVNEVVWQTYKFAGEEYKEQVTVKLSDYIGNPLQKDQNIRENFAQGLIPHRVAVQRVNELTDEDTEEYMREIEADDKKRREADAQFMPQDFNESDYFGDGITDGNTGKLKQSNVVVADRRNEDPTGGN